MEHTITFEAEEALDHGVPVDRDGSPSSFVSKRLTGVASCSCGWSGTNKQAELHAAAASSLDGIRSEIKDKTLAAIEAGMSEYEAAELAGVTRMTIRSWQGK